MALAEASTWVNITLKTGAYHFHKPRSWFIGDDAVKRLNLYELYDFGTKLAPLSRIDTASKINDFIFEMWWARMGLMQFCSEDSVLLQTSKRAASALISAISEVLPQDPKEFASIDKEKIFDWYYSNQITTALSKLETVLTNDMPGISAYFVVQKGLYKTEDLINHAEIALLEGTRKNLSAQVIDDLRSAGKCLAFEVPIACAFHIYRAIEEVMRIYYQSLTGKTFEANGVSRNWGAYVKALNDAGADSKVTQFLDHIREEYRNPQTHPDETVTVEEAFSLFNAALSSITQIVICTEEARKTKSLPGATLLTAGAKTP